MSAAYRDFYRGRRVMVTGGLGFIGSNLAIDLVARGAKVSIVDSLVPSHGGDPRNVAAIASQTFAFILEGRWNKPKVT